MAYSATFVSTVTDVGGDLFTQEELNEWNKRRTLATAKYKSKGDFSTNNPADWDRIKLCADYFKADPVNRDNYTNYYKLGDDTVEFPKGGVYDPTSRPVTGTGNQVVMMMTQCAALWYRLTGDTTYGNPAKAKLLDIVRGKGNYEYILGGKPYPAFDMWNRKRFTPNGFVDLNPGFTIVSSVLYAFLKIFHLVRPLLSTGEESECKYWLKGTGEWAQTHYEPGYNGLFITQGTARLASLDYRPKNPTEQRTGDVKLLYYGGPNAHQIERNAGNRRVDFACYAGLVALAIGTADPKTNPMLASAEQYFKEMIMFAVWPTGYYVDIMRGIQDNSPDKGYGYSVHGFPTLFAEASARKGRTELYDFTTKLGSISPEMFDAMSATEKANNKLPITYNGGHTSDLTTPKSFKRMIYANLNLRNHVGKGWDKDATYTPIYATFDSAQVGNPAYLIDGLSDTSQQVQDIIYSMAGNYYKDDYISLSSIRKWVGSGVTAGKSSPAWPSNAQVVGPADGWTFHLIPGAVGMYGGNYLNVYPYPVSGSQAQSITFAKPADITYGASFTLVASAAGGTVTFSIDPTSVGKGTISVSGSTTTFTSTAAGLVKIIASQGGNATYGKAPDVIQSFTVNKKAIQVTANSFSSPYNTVTRTYSVTLRSTDFVGTDSVSSIDSLPTATCPAVQTSAGSTTYVITPSGGLDNNYSFTYVTGLLTVTPIAQVISQSAALNKVAGDADFSLVPSSTSGLTAFTYSLQSGTSVTGVNSAGLVDLNGTTGNSTIRISQAGNSNYTAAFLDVIVAVNSVAKTDQLITFVQPAARTWGDIDGTFAVSTNASGLTPQLVSLDTSILQITGTNGYHIVASGQVTIRATQTGNGTYNAAPFVDRVITVNKKTLSITGAAATKVYGQQNPALTWNSFSSQLVNGDTTAVVTGLIAQTNALQSSVVGTSYYVRPSGGIATNYAFSYFDGVFSITKASQFTTFPSIPDSPANSNPIPLGATTSSGLPPVYSIISGPATIVGNTAKLNGTTGTVVVAANNGGNSNYNAAPQVTQSFVVTAVVKQVQNITYVPVVRQKYGNPDFYVLATTDKDQEVNVELISGPGYLAGGTAPTTCQIIGAGTIRLRLTSPGNTLYLPANPIDIDIIVAKADRTITFNALPNKQLGDPDITVSATVDTAEDVLFQADTTNLTQVGDATFHLEAAGLATVSAYLLESANYNEASVKRSFQITDVSVPTKVNFLSTSTPRITPGNAPIENSLKTLFFRQYTWTTNNYQFDKGAIKFVKGNAIPNFRILLKNSVGAWEVFLTVSGNLKDLYEFTLDPVVCYKGIRFECIGNDPAVKIVSMEMYGTVYA